MGIKHLSKVEKILKDSKDPITKYNIRKSISVDPTTLDECIEYLIKRGDVFVENNKKGIETYRWIGELPVKPKK